MGDFNSFEFLRHLVVHCLLLHLNHYGFNNHNQIFRDGALLGAPGGIMGIFLHGIHNRGEYRHQRSVSEGSKASGARSEERIVHAF